MVGLVSILLGTITPALAVGRAHVVSNCGFPVWYASVVQDVDVPLTPLPARGFTQVYSLDGVGVSIKLAPSPGGPVTQFEYTWANGMINYDLSNIDGNPLAAGGMTLVPSTTNTTDFPTCNKVECLPCTNSSEPCYCDGAYNHPDDVRTLVCSENTDLTMTLCSHFSTKRSLDADMPYWPIVRNSTDQPFTRQLLTRRHIPRPLKVLRR
jgi:hypothetical protein